MEYRDYLKTAHWKNLRAQKRKTRCGICNSSKNLDTHHLSYKSLLDVSKSDLRKLCRRCHFLAHDLAKAGKIQFKNTNHHHRFVILKREVKRALGILNKNMFNGENFLDPDYKPQITPCSLKKE